jgi:hypothetical protein
MEALENGGLDELNNVNESSDDEDEVRVCVHCLACFCCGAICVSGQEHVVMRVHDHVCVLCMCRMMRKRKQTERGCVVEVWSGTNARMRARRKRRRRYVSAEVF